MNNCSSMNTLLYSQPSCVEAIKVLNHQKNSRKDDLALKKASQDFEAILINFVVSSMWKTIQKSDLSGENDGGMETYTEIMHTTLSQDIAARGGVGVAPVIYEQLIRNKELAEGTPTFSSVKNDNYLQEISEDREDKPLQSIKEKRTGGVIQP